MNIYQTKHPAYRAYAAYVDGVLSGVEITKANFELLDKLHDVPMAPFPMLESDLELMCDKPLINIPEPKATTKIERMTVPAKIRLWCASYKKHRNTTYNVSTKEKANLAKTAITPALLAAYFNCQEYWATTNHYDLGTYIREINKVRDLAANGVVKREKSRWPDTFNPQLLHKLQPQEVQEYYAHLRSKGLKPIKDQQGRIIKWQ